MRSQDQWSINAPLFGYFAQLLLPKVAHPKQPTNCRICKSVVELLDDGPEQDCESVFRSQYGKYKLARSVGDLPEQPSDYTDRAGPGY